MRLRVEGKAVGDPIARYYGLGIDQDLDVRFWETQIWTYRRIVFDYFVDELEVPDGTGFVVVGISATRGYWHVKVYAEGRLVGEGDVAVPGAYPGSPGYLKVKLPAPLLEILEASFNVKAVNVLGSWEVLVKNVGAEGPGDVRMRLLSGPASIKIIKMLTREYEVPVGGVLSLCEIEKPQLPLPWTFVRGAAYLFTGNVIFTAPGKYTVRIETVRYEDGVEVLHSYADVAVTVETIKPVLRFAEVFFQENVLVGEHREWRVKVVNAGGEGEGEVKFKLSSGPAPVKLLIAWKEYEVPVRGELSLSSIVMPTKVFPSGWTFAISGWMVFSAEGTYLIRVEAIHYEDGRPVVDDYVEITINVMALAPPPTVAPPVVAPPPPAPPPPPPAVAPPPAIAPPAIAPPPPPVAPPPPPPALPVTAVIAVVGVASLAIAGLIFARKLKKR